MNELFLDNVMLASGNGSFISQVFAMMLGVFAAAYFLKGQIQTGGLWNVFLLAVIIIILNKTIGAILQTLATPFNYVTFGVVSFVVDALIIQMAGWFLSKFRVKSFMTAILMAVIIAIVSAVVEWVF